MKLQRLCSVLLAGVLGLSMTAVIPSCNNNSETSKGDINGKTLTIKDTQDGEVVEHTFNFSKGGSLMYVANHISCPDGIPTATASYSGVYEVDDHGGGYHIDCSVYLVHVDDSNPDRWDKTVTFELDFAKHDSALSLTSARRKSNGQEVDIPTTATSWK